ncbi:MAG TPA: class I SAM-dependent rRNA methyltransferase [Candidatus Bathyarchaeia archaeon]|nr:class I SAM-dependent rRNA methyltransferase [Candidatus Bathyarchaeia archaeon]
MNDPLPSVKISRKAEERIRCGHLWVFGDDLREVPPRLPYGQWVLVTSRAGEILGTATCNLASRIALRLVSHGTVRSPRLFLEKRIRQALRRREEAGMGDLEALRLVYSEGDFLPGLVVDRCGTLLSVQILTAGMELVRREIVSVLDDLLCPRLLYERSEGVFRRLEGLPERKGVLGGNGPPQETVTLDGCRFLVDAEAGPKTGFFLDHRENRRIVRGLARGKSVLDGFCSTGAFGIYALAGGAASVLGIDVSGEAVAAASENAARNGFGDRWEGRAGNLFPVLRELLSAGRRFDLVILDPPSFAKSRQGREGAVRGYRDINRLGLSLLAPGGILATASCTQLVDMAKWYEALREAAADARVDVHVVAKGGQSPDHPVLLGVPETEYLKFAVLRVGGT